MGFLNKLSGISPVTSRHGEMVDHMLEIIHWIMLALFIGWSIFLVIAFWKHHHTRNPKASYVGVQSNANSHLEVGVIITEIILLLGFAFPLWGNQVQDFPNPDVRVRAWAYQFGWHFHYSGPDGRFGQTNRFKMTSDNPIGLDPEDPNSADDQITSRLGLPVNKNVEISVTSKDVIHNLSLVSMRSQVDADPGKVNRMWFVPTVTGVTEIICGQLCGEAHGNMRAECEVFSAAGFEDWIKGQNKALSESVAPPAAAPAPAPAAAAAAAAPAVK